MTRSLEQSESYPTDWNWEFGIDGFMIKIPRLNTVEGVIFGNPINTILRRFPGPNRV
jgi:hypothetical protein